MDYSFPVVEVLTSQRKIKSVGVSSRLQVSRGRTLAEHLQNRIARHQVNQKEHQ